jgi:transcriptional regulator with GAF, ATPase, and Fis domain
MSVLSKKVHEAVGGLGSDPCDRLQPGEALLEDDRLTRAVDLGGFPFVSQQVPDQQSLLDEVALVRQHLQSRYSFQNVVSRSPRMYAIFDLIGRLAHTATTVLIEGETGTGKEEVARALHQASRARVGPLVAVTCSALSEQLIESELFGHEKGAFTSAVGQRKGRFELADEGTLFLDEIGDIPRFVQCKLLRVLQERRFERVGGSQSIGVDVRVVAATNRCLREMVQDGKFREDLYYRLNVVKIALPPLRERREDIPLLAVHFAQKFAQPDQPPKRLSPACWEPLLRYSWPGNVRQLENAIERGCVTALGDVVRLEDLPSEVVRPSEKKAASHIDWSRPLADLLAEMTARIERHYLRRALKCSRGNIARCARLCSLSRRSITTKLAKYQLNKSEFRKAPRQRPPSDW